MPASGVWIEINSANIRNDHIYLRDVIDFFPSDAIGGSNSASASPHTIDVEFNPGDTIQTDLAGDKRFLRARGAVKKFFRLAKAANGDRVLVTKIADRHFRFELVRS
jgi:DNA polymerase-3 subunit epsilon